MQFLFIFFLALSAGIGSGDGWYWETGNALGFGAFIFILLTARHRSIHHRWYGYLALLFLVLHIIWFLAGDPVVSEYLKIGAPTHMVYGLIAFMMLIILILFSTPQLRKVNFSSGPSFVTTHRWGSKIIITLSYLHIVLSGYYLSTYWQAGLLLLLILPALSHKPVLRPMHITGVLTMVMVAGAIFIILRK